MNKHPPLEDLRVFSYTARYMSFAKAAEKLLVSPAYVSKRIKLLESNLGLTLFKRNPRSVSLTSGGRIVEQYSNEILQQFEQMQLELLQASNSPTGTIRISCSTGFGSEFLEPFILLLREQYPDLSIELLLIDSAVDPLHDGIDLDISIGTPFSDQLYAKKLADNSRVFCASPEYLKKQGVPEKPDDLCSHQCIMIRERSHNDRSWNIQNNRDQISITPNSQLSVNNGKIAKKWCLEGQGIILRSIWDIEHELTNGELVQVLPMWYQSADVYALYHQRSDLNPNLRVFIEHLELYLQQQLPQRTAE